MYCVFCLPTTMPKNQAICQFIDLALPMTLREASCTQDYPQNLWPAVGFLSSPDITPKIFSRGLTRGVEHIEASLARLSKFASGSRDLCGK